MIRTLGRTLLLSAVAVLTLHSTAGGAEDKALNSTPDIQKKLSEPIKFELAVDTTLDKALDELLTRNGIPWSVNDAAFGPDNKDIVKKTTVEKFEERAYATSASILQGLLEKIPNDSGKTAPTFVLRTGHVEITTRDAVAREFCPGRLDSRLPSLAYAAFKQTPLPEALADLAHRTGTTVILDPKLVGAAQSKVTAELLGVPIDTALQVVADMADLKLVRLENVYYVTSRENAEILHKDWSRRRLEQRRILKQQSDGIGVLGNADGDSDSAPLPIIP
jgi:hypothetical protein